MSPTLGRLLYRVLISTLSRLPWWSHRRVRGVILCGQQVLLIKTWMSSQSWSVPGGGAHPNETDADAIAREVREETGIAIDSSEFFCVGKLFDARLGDVWPIYSAVITEAILPPMQFPYNFEIMDRSWFDLEALPADVPDIYRTAIELALDYKS